MSDDRKYAHEIARHPAEGEAMSLEHLTRYHYAQAQAWHLAFAEAIAGDISTGAYTLPLAHYLGHTKLAFLYDALSQGLTGQEAADWASVRTHSESAELVWERGVKYGIDPDEIRPYETAKESDR